MEVPISEMLKDKYNIDIEKSEMQKMIAKQVEIELQKRIPKHTREEMQINNSYNNLHNEMYNEKNGLKGIFNKDTIDQQIKGVKNFFKEHSLTPNTIKDNFKDILNWNTDNPTVEKLNNTFSKIQSLFKNEHTQINNLQNNQEHSLSDKFKNLSDLMNESLKTIDKSNQINEIRDFNQSNRLKEISQRLEIANDTETTYDFKELQANSNYKDIDSTLETYNYMKDVQTMIENSNPYERNHNTNNLKIEEFSLKTIQDIEKNIPEKDLIKGRISHLDNNNKATLPELPQMAQYSQEVNKLENNLQLSEKNTINQALETENLDNKTILESIQVQENEVFQQINGNSENTKQQDINSQNCEIVDVNNNQVFVNIDNDIYSVSVSDEDYNDIETNPQNYQFKYDPQNNKLTYNQIESSNNNHKNQERENDNSPSNAPKNDYLSSLDENIPPIIENESMDMER